MQSKKFSATDADGNDMSEELVFFSRIIGLETIAPERYSILLVLELFAGMKSGYLNPAKVIHEIKVLEGIETPNRTKSPSPFKYPPLQGLWHKHYLEDGLKAMTINLKKGIHKFGIPFLQQRIDEAQAAGEERYISVEDCKLIVDDVVRGNWLRLCNNAALTGEWIIYAQHEGLNYYLCLGRHDSGDQNLRARIDAICCLEFPFISDLFKNA